MNLNKLGNSSVSCCEVVDPTFQLGTTAIYISHEISDLSGIIILIYIYHIKSSQRPLLSPRCEFTIQQPTISHQPTNKQHISTLAYQPYPPPPHSYITLELFPSSHPWHFVSFSPVRQAPTSFFSSPLRAWTLIRPPILLIAGKITGSWDDDAEVQPAAHYRGHSFGMC